MQSAIAQVTQHFLLAASLVLASTLSLHAQEPNSADPPVHSGASVPHSGSSAFHQTARFPVTANTQPTFLLNRGTPRTLQEAGLDPHTVFLTSTPTLTVAPPIAKVSQASSVAEVPIYQPLLPQISGSFTSGPGVGYDSAYFALEGFVPLVQTPGQSIGYLQGRFTVDTAEGNQGGNLLLGYRTFDSKTSTILGGYLGFDSRNTGRATFNQLGAGLEVLLPNVEFRVNGYLPLGSRRRQIGENSSSTINTTNITTSSPPRFQGNSLVMDMLVFNQQLLSTRTSQLFETSLAGFDTEVGVKLWQWSPVGNLRSYLGLYYYDGPGIGGFVGVRGRLEARLTENIQAGLSIQADREFGTTAVLSLGFRFPGLGSNQTTPQQIAWARAGESPFRQTNVAVTQRSTTNVVTTVVGETSTNGASGTVALLNPATNQPWVFQHVTLGTTGGNGTFENPFGTVANGLAATQTDGNSIVYVQAGTNPGIPAFTLPTNVQMLSNGVTQQIPTVQQGLTTLPLSGSGILPRITGTVTMGNGSTLAGFKVTPPTNHGGIVADGVQNVTLRQNWISVSGNNTPGMVSQDVTGSAVVTGNTVSTQGDTIGLPGSYGIVASLTDTELSKLVLSDNTIRTSGEGAHGIYILPHNNSSITDVTLVNNIITTTGFIARGILVFPNNNSSITNATLSGNTVSTSGTNAHGIWLLPQAKSSIINAVLSGNTVNTSGNVTNGIFIFPETGFISNLTLSGNTVNTSGSDAHGIFVVPDISSINRATLVGNIISTSGSVAHGIFVLPSFNSHISALTLANNILVQAGADSVQINNQSGQPLCLAILGNRSQSPNFAGGGGVDFNLISNAQPFQVINLANLSVDNFSGTFQYDGAPAPATPPFANAITCP